MANTTDINKLITLAKKHDRTAQQKIIDLYLPFIKKIVRYYGLFLPKEDKEDLLIEALFATLRSIEHYNEKSGKFEDFLFINIRNRILDNLRARKSTLPIEDALTKTYDFLDEMYVKEEIEEFEKTLTPKEREVFKLYLDGLKISEISELLKQDYKSIDNTLQRIKKKAKKFIGV